MKLKYIVVLISIACIVILYVLSLLSQPIAISLADVPSYEGQQVIITGTVTQQHTTTYGHMIEINDVDDDNSTSIIIYVEEQTTIEYGDKIQATGTVQKYNDEWELIVPNAKAIQTLQKWENITMPLWQLAEHPTRYTGINVNITGIIDRDYDSYFYVIDPDDKHTLMVSYSSEKKQNISQGSQVLVRGQFLYDEETLRYLIVVSEEHHSISTTWAE